MLGNPYSTLEHAVWCSYALGARPVVVISPEGKIFFQRAWLQVDHVAEALDKFWAGLPGTGGGQKIEDNSGIPPVNRVIGVP